MEGVEMGPLISERQRSRVASFVERAADQKHIEITTGGKSTNGRGFFYEPTVIAGAPGRRDRTPRSIRPCCVGHAL
jgi:aminobutyraldehyde dehydrogenase